MQLYIHKALLDGVYALLFYNSKATEEAVWTIYHRNKLAIGAEGETLQDNTGTFQTRWGTKTLSGSKWDWPSRGE